MVKNASSTGILKVALYNWTNKRSLPTNLFLYVLRFDSSPPTWQTAWLFDEHLAFSLSECRTWCTFSCILRSFTCVHGQFDAFCVKARNNLTWLFKVGILGDNWFIFTLESLAAMQKCPVEGCIRNGDQCVINEADEVIYQDELSAVCPMMCSRVFNIFYRTCWRSLLLETIATGMYISGKFGYVISAAQTYI